MSVASLNAALARLKKDSSYGAYGAVSSALDHFQGLEKPYSFLRVAFLRNFTLDPLIPVIKGEAALAEFFPEIYLGGFDQIPQDVFDPQSALYQFKPDLIFLLQWLDPLAPGLTGRFASLSPEQVDDEIARVLALVRQFVTMIRQYSDKPVVLNNFPLPSYPAMGIVDVQVQAVLTLNAGLRQLAKEVADIFLVDMMSVLARIGAERGIDERYWQVGRAPLGPAALLPVGREFGKFIRALNGRTRKCLVLDCDQVLWGGIVGEDGLKGIRIGTTFPGSCFQDFQREVLNLHDRGVLLALCSKNNEADVLEVFRSHSGMLLREEHFAARRINWEDKATNLEAIARELNIGLDSLVFVDDSPFECDLVRERLPQVAVVELSAESWRARSQLMAGGYFDALTFSGEDRQRTRMYRDDARRKVLSAATGTLEEYLAMLGMIAGIGRAGEAEISRIAQLTQKTNQFNLTTQRYTEDEIRRLAGDPAVDVFYLRLRDKVSDMGIVGVGIIKYQAQQARIDTFLLSCRVLGREVEKAFFSCMIDAVLERNCRLVRGQFLATAKNAPAADFYRLLGFVPAAENSRGVDWELSLTGAFPRPAMIGIEVIEPKE
ncbi:MAG: HAD family hydrolase [Candidatus Omnitrophica bacterium]|nr:HAD family hydrolase [Candidatus Omnitrophota bacterium]